MQNFNKTMIDSSDCCNGDSNSQHEISNTGNNNISTLNSTNQISSLAGINLHSLHNNNGSEDDELVPHVLREQDRYLPIANVAKIMKKAIPERGKIAKDAKECVQECVSEFISFITSEAAERCALEKRKTINGEDILYAMQTLGFDNYVEPLKIFLQKYRDATKCEKGTTNATTICPTSSSNTTTNINYASLQQHTDSTLPDDFLSTTTNNNHVIILSNGTTVQAQNILQLNTTQQQTSTTNGHDENQLLGDDEDDDDDVDDFEELGMKNSKRLKRSNSTAKQQTPAFIINGTDSKIF